MIALAGPGWLQSFGLADLGTIVMFGAVLPLVLSIAIVCMRFAWGPPLGIELVPRIVGDGAPPGPMHPRDSEILEEWRAQQQIIRIAWRPGALLALLHGLLATLGLLLSAKLLQQTLPHGCANHGLLRQIEVSLSGESFHRWSQLELVGFAVMASIATHTALVYGQLARRVARRDLTPRALSDALRHLLAGVLVGVVTVALLQLERTWLEPVHALFAGGLMGLIGPPLLELIDQGTSIIFGLYSTSEDGLVDCTEVDGLDDVDRQRLQEIGIDSLHSLAYGSVALIYLSSRYSYERICDWKDQALLQVLVGQKLKVRLAKEWGIRCATELRDALVQNVHALEDLGLTDKRAVHLASVLLNDHGVSLMTLWWAHHPRVRPNPAATARAPE